MIKAVLVGDKALIARLQAMAPKVRANIQKTVTKLSVQLQGVIKDKLHGAVLNIKHGRLIRSINYRVESTEQQITGHVGSNAARGGPPVEYALIHEFGGTIQHPGGTAYFLDTQGMARFIRNDNILADRLPRTRPHAIHMRERSFLRSSIDEMRGYIQRDIREVLIGTVQGGLH